MNCWLFAGRLLVVCQPTVGHVRPLSADFWSTVYRQTTDRFLGELLINFTKKVKIVQKHNSHFILPCVSLFGNLRIIIHWQINFLLTADDPKSGQYSEDEGWQFITLGDQVR